MSSSEDDDGASSSTSSSESTSDLPSRILILYASETGNAQDIAERTGREIRRRGGRCLVQSMVEFDILELPHTPLLILINSTHGRGQPPPDMVTLWSALLRSGLPSDILEDVHFAIYGLGDSSYEKFCYAGKILARRMISLGAQLLTAPTATATPTSTHTVPSAAPSAQATTGAGMGRNGTTNGSGSYMKLEKQLERGLHITERENGSEREATDADVDEEEDEDEDEDEDEGEDDTDTDEFGRTACLAWGDERAPEGLEETFIPWLSKTMAAMLPLLHPPPPVLPDIPSITSLPRPLYRIHKVSRAEPVPPPLPLVTQNGISEQEEEEAGGGGRKNVKQSLASGDDVLEPGWVWTRLSRNKRVTDEGWFQDVREVHLDLEQALEYEPGSICSLKPQTSEEEVQAFIVMNKLEEEADQAFVIQPIDTDQQVPLHLPRGKPTTLRRILRDHVDVRQPPRNPFFEWMARFTTSELERERLEEFLADPDEIHTYATRSRRTILETLADFRSTRIPMSHILEVLPPLRRRQFSIASSAKVHPGEIQLLVGLVEYKTNLKIKRKGLLSSWLQGLPEGYRIPTKVDAPTLFLPPQSANVPVILVGPGTGVAPMRAFAEERIRQGQGKNTAIYFGCRSKQHDFYYADEWDAMRKAGMTVRIAFSRDQDEKLYVQDLIKEDAKLIKEWIHDRLGNIYISGSSNAMPKQVRSAVAWSISDESGVGVITREEADKYVEDMFMSGTRGGEESW